MNPKQLGVTLLEILLVLAIAAFILVLTFGRYQSYLREKDAEQVKYNVDLLLESLAYYYQANCKRTTPPAPLNPLDPNHVPPPPDPFPIDIVVALVNNHFLSQWPFPWNPIVGDAKSYIVQFNKATNRRYVNTCYSLWDSQPPYHQCQVPPEPIQKTDSVVIWQAQVAVKIVDPELVQYYKNRLGADCISSIASNATGTVVKPCNQSTGTGDYIVWERLPSFASPNLSSDLFPSMMVLKQFNAQYTNDEFYARMYDKTDYDQQTGYETYLCGG